MPRFWNRLLGKLLPGESIHVPTAAAPSKLPTEASATPQMAPTPTSSSQTAYPNTYQTIANEDYKIWRPQVFEPALKHYSYAFRRGDPVFQDRQSGKRWSDIRLQVLHHVVQLVVGSRWNYHLVLRGSLLLRTWLGEAARDPGDIDWVFIPPNVGLDHTISRQLFDELIQLVVENPRVGNALIDVESISVDDIWTYERASGRRVLIPWRSEELPPGAVQMDVVFGEQLWSGPILTQITAPAGGSILVSTATKEESLAWKLLWLETDMYPQGKDLYDAALLAEQTILPFSLLDRVLQTGGRSIAKLKSDFPLKLQVDWENFKLEYPTVDGDAKDWQARLARALAPTFALSDG
jgi:hypothetical protein